MTRVQGGFELRDLDSTNGVKVNGQRVPVVVLRDECSIELGDVAFNFELAPEERAVLDMEASVALGAEALPQQTPSVLLPTTSPSMPPASTPIPVPSISSQRPVVPRAPVTVVASGGGNGGGGGFLLLVLALVGFCVGMAFRYHEDTGRSWIDAVRDKYTASQGPAAPPR